MIEGAVAVADVPEKVFDQWAVRVARLRLDGKSLPKIVGAVRNRVCAAGWLEDDAANLAAQLVGLPSSGLYDRLLGSVTFRPELPIGMPFVLLSTAKICGTAGLIRSATRPALGPPL